MKYLSEYRDAQGCATRLGGAASAPVVRAPNGGKLASYEVEEGASQPASPGQPTKTVATIPVISLSALFPTVQTASPGVA